MADYPGAIVPSSNKKGGGKKVPPIITITNVTTGRISDETSKDSCVVTFRSDQDLINWEARADGTGRGDGLLVGFGGIEQANMDVIFEVTYDELTNGDGWYRINVYGRDAAGEWTTYGQ